MELKLLKRSVQFSFFIFPKNLLKKGISIVTKLEVYNTVYITGKILLSHSNWIDGKLYSWNEKDTHSQFGGRKPRKSP